MLGVLALILLATTLGTALWARSARLRLTAAPADRADDSFLLVGPPMTAQPAPGNPPPGPASTFAASRTSDTERGRMPLRGAANREPLWLKAPTLDRNRARVIGWLRVQELTDAVETWWKKAQRRLAELPDETAR